MCAQRTLRSEWASAQSDQSLRCPHDESMGPWLPIERAHSEDSDAQADLSSLSAGHFVSFVLRWLIFYVYRTSCFTRETTKATFLQW